MAKQKTVKHEIPKPDYSFRRNTLPPLLGLVTFMMSLVALNFQWLYAQVEYNLAARKPATVLSLDTTADAETSRRPQTTPSIWIPGINVHAPLVFETSTNEKNIQQALQQGVVHYPMTGIPGEDGNVVLFGHSSGQPWAPGDYKFVFTLLDKMKKGDQIVLDYNGIRYVYAVTRSFVVDPYQTKVLDPTEKPSVTLITCTPVGTNEKRLVVVAEQVSPKPVDVKTDAEDTTPFTSSTPRKLPSDAMPFWQSVTNR